MHMQAIGQPGGSLQILSFYYLRISSIYVFCLNQIHPSFLPYNLFLSLLPLPHYTLFLFFLSLFFLS